MSNGIRFWNDMAQASAGSMEEVHAKPIMVGNPITGDTEFMYLGTAFEAGQYMPFRYVQQQLNSVTYGGSGSHICSYNEILANIEVLFSGVYGSHGKCTLFIKNISNEDITITFPTVNTMYYAPNTNIAKLKAKQVLHVRLTCANYIQLIQHDVLTAFEQPDTDEIPNIFDVWNEEIIDGVSEDVCRIGEQVWARKNVQYTGSITDNFIGKFDKYRIYNWRTYFPWANIPLQIPTSPDDPAITQLVEECHTVFGKTYFSLVFIGGNNPGDTGIINQYDKINGDSLYKHNIPNLEDLRQLFAFTLCDHWDGNGEITETIVNKTKGVLGIKGTLGDDPNDNMRYTYPTSWPRDILINGSDKYGLALAGSGRVHRGDASAANITNSMFIAGCFLIKPISAGAPYNINTWQYRKSTPVNSVSDMTYGSMLRDENSAALGGTIRSVRYKQLTYDFYSNGIDIKQIKNGDSIPSGYTPVPKGSLRGAYIAKRNFSIAQLKKVADYVDSITKQWIYSIG